MHGKSFEVDLQMMFRNRRKVVDDAASSTRSVEIINHIPSFSSPESIHGKQMRVQVVS